ncbi:MAG: thioredoxin-disulfide reductase [Candidatus Aenigmatarchaeota archaeon]
MYDVIIVGAGPAGLTAAIYTTRKKMKTLVISKNIGGQTAITNDIENYPGFDKINGYELMTKLENQAIKFGAEIKFGEVNKIEKKENIFLVKTENEIYECRSVILAFGKTPKSLEIPGESTYKGRGVSYCATCDAPLFDDKTVVVVGGGNSALEAALLLSKIAKKIYIIHRRDAFRGDELTIDNVKKNKKIELVLNSVPIEIKGDKFVRSLTIQDVNTKQKKELNVDGIFVEIGYEVKTDFLKDFVKLDDKGQIIVNEYCETSQPGVFAAGDVTNVPYKQIVISAGEGAKAGISAYNYIQKLEGKSVMIGDWTKDK